MTKPNFQAESINSNVLSPLHLRNFSKSATQLHITINLSFIFISAWTRKLEELNATWPYHKLTSEPSDNQRNQWIGKSSQGKTVWILFLLVFLHLFNPTVMGKITGESRIILDSNRQFSAFLCL